MKPAKIKKLKPILICLSIIGSLIIPKTKVLAQTATGFSAIPPQVDIKVEANGVYTKELKVRNESNETKTVDVYFKDFVVNNNKGHPTFLDDISNENNRWAASSWLQVSQSSLIIKPGETKSLWLTVMPPKNALPGGHYAGVFYRPKSLGSLNTTGSAITMDVGSLIYITVAGEVNQKASVQSFSAPIFSEFGPIDFKATVKNSSDIHIQPKGAITVNNWFGREIDKLQLTETNIFPYTTRDFTNTLNKKWLFGRYRANFEAYYGTAGGLIAATLFFWVIPWRLIILIIAAAAVISALMIISKNKPKKSKTGSSTEVAELEKELEMLKKKYKDN